MRCNYNLCIYYLDGICTVDEVVINELGMFDVCIIVDIPEDYITEKRREAMERFKKHYKNWEGECVRG